MAAGANGGAGTVERGDCRVHATTAKDTAITVHCGNPPLLASGIQSVIERVLETMDPGPCAIQIEDHGALDYVIAARVEAALRGLGRAIAPIVPAVVRAPSRRDRVRRSRLYAPGSNPRLLAGIELHGADCVLLDLEDAVPAAEKLAARLLVKHLLGAVCFPAEVWVRINPLGEGGEDDIRELVPARPHGLCLPKAERDEEVVAASEAIAAVEEEHGIETGSVWLMPIVETAAGVLHSEAIAGAAPRVVALAFGAEDYLRDTGATRSREALLWPRSRLLAAARAARIQVSDTVYAAVEDDCGLEEEAVHVRGLGFDGKGAIHPRQVAVIHRAFAPSAEEIERARRIVAAAEEGEARGRGAVSVDGRMVDRPVLERARRTVRLADEAPAGGAA
jgi:citrate lyase subunit beta/citryl-CoA lyase